MAEKRSMEKEAMTIPRAPETFDKRGMVIDIKGIPGVSVVKEGEHSQPQRASLIISRSILIEQGRQSAAYFTTLSQFLESTF